MNDFYMRLKLDFTAGTLFEQVLLGHVETDAPIFLICRKYKYMITSMDKNAVCFARQAAFTVTTLLICII